MEHPGDVESPFAWLGGSDGWWNDLLSMIFAGSTWPEGSESAMWELSDQWRELGEALAASSEELQAAATQLMAGWDAPATETFADLAQQLIASPDSGLVAHMQNVAMMAEQTSGFALETQYAKISINVAVAVAVAAAFVALMTAWLGGVSLAALGPIALTGRTAVSAAVQKLVAAAGRSFATRAVTRATARGLGTQLAGAAGRGAVQRVVTHRLTHEVVEEVLEETAIDVISQGIQVVNGDRTDWNWTSTGISAVAGGTGGLIGAGAVAPALARLRGTRGLNRVDDLGRDAAGNSLPGLRNSGLRTMDGLATTAATNTVASPAGSVVGNLVVTGQLVLPTGGDFLGAALGAAGRYGTISPFNPSVIRAVVDPVGALSNLQMDTAAGLLGRADAAPSTAPGVGAAPPAGGAGSGSGPVGPTGSGPGSAGSTGSGSGTAGSTGSTSGAGPASSGGATAPGSQGAASPAPAHGGAAAAPDAAPAQSQAPESAPAQSAAPASTAADAGPSPATAPTAETPSPGTATASDAAPSASPPAAAPSDAAPSDAGPAATAAPVDATAPPTATGADTAGLPAPVAAASTDAGSPVVASGPPAEGTGAPPATGATSTPAAGTTPAPGGTAPANQGSGATPGAQRTDGGTGTPASDGAPVETSPSTPGEVGHTAADSAPADSAPADTAPADSASTDSAPADSPAGTPPAGPPPTPSTLADGSPADGSPAPAPPTPAAAQAQIAAAVSVDALVDRLAEQSARDGTRTFSRAEVEAALRARVAGQRSAPVIPDDGAPSGDPAGTGPVSESGGQVRPRNVLDPDVQEEWAGRVYAALVADPSVVPTMEQALRDTARLDGSTGFSRAELEQVLRHVVVDEHLLNDPETNLPTRVARFDPDADMAEAFLRVLRGRPTPADVLLLEHEVAEAQYLAAQPDATYRQAHAYANRRADWEAQTRERTGETIEGWEVAGGDPRGVPQGGRDAGVGGVPVRPDRGPAGDDAGDRPASADGDTDGRGGRTADAAGGTRAGQTAAGDGDVARARGDRALGEAGRPPGDPAATRGPGELGAAPRSGAEVGGDPRGERTRESGAGRWSVDDPAVWERAEQAYDRFRADDSDIDRIAANLAGTLRADGVRRFDAADVAVVKQHVMRDEHTLIDPDTGAPTRRRFDADPKIAEAWLRMQSGAPAPSDVTLLEHELLEASLMRADADLTYRAAHARANVDHDWESLVYPEPARGPGGTGAERGGSRVLDEGGGDRDGGELHLRPEPRGAAGAADGRQVDGGADVGDRSVRPPGSGGGREVARDGVADGELAGPGRAPGLNLGRDAGGADAAAAGADETGPDPGSGPGSGPTGRSGDVPVRLVDGTLHTPSTGLDTVQLPPSFSDSVADHLPDGMTAAEFDRLRVQRAEDLTELQREQLRSIRESVRFPPDTLVQRVMPRAHADSYLSGATFTDAQGTVTFRHTHAAGFVARLGDVADLRTVPDVIEGLRLDYEPGPFLGSVESVATLRFPLPPTARVAAPYAPVMGGEHEQPAPFTGNGFTMSARHRVPEAVPAAPVELPDGAELWSVAADGTETLLGVYDGFERTWIGVAPDQDPHPDPQEDHDGGTAAPGRPVRGVAGTDLSGLEQRGPGDPAGVLGEPGGPAVHAGSGRPGMAPPGADQRGAPGAAELAVPVAGRGVLGAVPQQPAGSPAAELDRDGPGAGRRPGADTGGQVRVGGDGPRVGGDRHGAGPHDGLSPDDGSGPDAGAWQAHQQGDDGSALLGPGDVPGDDGRAEGPGRAPRRDDPGRGDPAPRGDRSADPGTLLRSAHAEHGGGTPDGAPAAPGGRADARLDAGQPTGGLSDPAPQDGSREPGPADPTGVPRPVVEPGRYLDPGDEVAARLREAHERANDVRQWLGGINPNWTAIPAQDPAAGPWRYNCGDCSRRFADAYQGLDVSPAWGDTRLGETAEMWQWAGAEPASTLSDDDGSDPAEFTRRAWDALERSLADLPPGTVAIVGVDWSDGGGHWFDAVRTEAGTWWVDAQTGEASPWPPGYGDPIRVLEAVARRPGGRWEGVDVVRAAGTGGGRADSGPRVAAVERDAAAVPGGVGDPAVPGRDAGRPGAAEAGGAAVPGPRERRPDGALGPDAVDGAALRRAGGPADRGSLTRPSTDAAVALARQLEQQALAALTAEQRAELDASVRQVEAVADEVTARLGALVSAAATATGVGMRLEGLGHRVKTAASLARKVEADVHAGVPLAEALEEIGDRLRFTVVTSAEDYTSAVTEVVGRLQDLGSPSVKNLWREGNRFLGLNVTVQPADGPAFEVQFPTEESYRVGAATHGDYEVFRLGHEVAGPLALPPALGRILDANRAAGLDTAIPAGVEDAFGAAVDTGAARTVRRQPDMVARYVAAVAALGTSIEAHLESEGVTAGTATELARVIRGEDEGADESTSGLPGGPGSAEPDAAEHPRGPPGTLVTRDAAEPGRGQVGVRSGSGAAGTDPGPGRRDGRDHRGGPDAGRGTGRGTGDDAARRAGADRPDGSGGHPGPAAPDRLTGREADSRAELAELRQRMTALSPLTRVRAGGRAAALLRSLQLVQGVADPATGQVSGASPGFAERLAALPPDTRADVLTLNQALGWSGVPDAVAGRWATAVRVVFGGGAPAVLAQVPALAIGLLSGDAGRALTAVTSAAAGLAGSVGAGFADRALARQTARLQAHDLARQGLTPAVRSVLAAARARLDGDLTTAAAELAQLETRRSTAPARPRGPRRLAGRWTGGRVPGAPAAASGPVAAQLAAGPTGAPGLDADARLPRLGAWLAKAAAAPAFGLVGLGVLAVTALPVSTTLAAGLGVSLGAAAFASVAQRALAAQAARLDVARTTLLDARTATLARATADREIADAVAQRDRARSRLDAVDGRPVGPVPPPAQGDRLVPGRTSGVITEADLTPADRQRLQRVEADARALAELPPGASRATVTALTERLRASAAEAGMTSDAAVDTGGDPDRSGWPRRRVLLAPALLDVLQRLDEVPSAVPGLAAHLGAAAVGTALPGALSATIAASAAVGLGPLALITIGLAPAAAAAASAVRTHRAAVAVETAKNRSRSADLPGPARALLDTELADLRAETATLVEAADARAESTPPPGDRRERALARARTTLGPDAAARLARRPADPPPAPVPVKPPVTAPWLESTATAVAGPVVTATAALAAWQVLHAAHFGPIWSPATWTALVAGTPAATSATVVAATVVAVGATALTDSTETLLSRSKARAEQQRSAALTVHEHVLARAARDALLDADRVRLGELRRQLAERRAELGAGRIAAELGSGAASDPGTALFTWARAVAWLAGQVEGVVRLVARRAPAGGPVHRAALDRLAAGLPATRPADAAGTLAVVLDELERTPPAPADGGLPTGPELQRVVDAAATVGSPARAGRTGIDWAYVTAVANATGWWRDDEEAVGLRPVRPVPGFRPPPQQSKPEPSKPQPAQQEQSAPSERQPSEPRPSEPEQAERGPSAPSPAPGPAAAPRASTPQARPAPAAAPSPPVLDEPWSDGTGHTRTTLVTVVSPGGAVVPLVVSWVEAVGSPPALVLAELPGRPFWWGVPVALQQAVDAALAALTPPADRLPHAVVLGQRQGDPDPSRSGRLPFELAVLPVEVGGGTAVPVPGRSVRPLPAGDVAIAATAWRLRPAAELLSALNRPRTPAG
ncbi:toxin glutamine deamidase domain-containing protein [Blastococcus sp. TF02A-26]|uniref:WXG100-like domain-containing protein n=1 Tax=Blastococcus sp. TF02A-26 TaxID=2250577 RepID=UPI000DE90880|nr:toxin glutamine deamidase domain-containing protein [Blastococcus sp. TF02A-26]RBY86108.1 hypothetical protein DQ240_09845 [Blastococcus sp. TF02A-26]